MRISWAFFLIGRFKPTVLCSLNWPTNQAVCGCTPLSVITADYLHLQLKALRNVFLNQGEGGAQPNISRVKIRKHPNILPPIAEQQAIVEKVNALMALCDALEQQIETSDTQVKQLMQSCLKEVFEMS